MLAEADPLPKRNRRRFQFSLRTLLIFTAIVAIPCAWLGRKVEQKRKEREAVAAITKLGGFVRYDFEFDKSGRALPNAEPPGANWLRNLLGENFFTEIQGVVLGKRANIPTPGDAGLVSLSEFSHIQMLMLTDADVTDIGLENLQGLRQLKWLYLSGTKVTSAGMVHLNGLTQLLRLDLSKTKISDAGLAHLTGLTSLSKLALRDTNVSDSGLVHLEGLAQLNELDLSGTNVGDAGLVHLKRLTSLRTLHLELNNVTHAGFDDLQNTLPKCAISFWHSDEPFRPNRSK